jgi:hypothetical protein
MVLNAQDVLNTKQLGAAGISWLDEVIVAEFICRDCDVHAHN